MYLYTILKIILIWDELNCIKSNYLRFDTITKSMLWYFKGIVFNIILDYAYLNMWKLKRGSNYIILGYADMVKLKEKGFKNLVFNIRLCLFEYVET